MAGAAQAHKIVLGVVAGILVFVMHDLGGPAATGAQRVAPQLPPPDMLPGRAVAPLGGAAPASVPAWRAWARASCAQAACSGQQPPTSTLRFLQPGLRHGRGGRVGIYPPTRHFARKKIWRPTRSAGPHLSRSDPPRGLRRGALPSQCILTGRERKTSGQEKIFVGPLALALRCRQVGSPSWTRWTDGTRDPVDRTSARTRSRESG